MEGEVRRFIHLHKRSWLEVDAVVPYSFFCRKQGCSEGLGLGSSSTHQYQYKSSVVMQILSEVEKVSEPGNIVPRNFFGFKFSQKVFKKILRLHKNWE